MGYTVIITAKKGKLTSRVEGISGPSCGEKTAWLDRLGRVSHIEDTEEYYELETESCDETATVDVTGGGDNEW